MQKYVGMWLNEKTKLRFQKKCLDNKTNISAIMRQLVNAYLKDESIIAENKAPEILKENSRGISSN